ncbi:multidrug effflux MFS transporter [Sneathiella litorea]|uniref:Bcr/CflA family efflux transporter n=1 Tax=Sneathiella litorea TaxID=2606216 RepID=A0A6L8W8E1_9PROT|nr:multidrug effflux MFS transporter [Sneathiella litorea]MZR31396.1 Bcr/CflA family efflux MFS transporter [Sneathiella litorea]
MSAPSKKLGFVEQVILLALMISMVALSIDVMLPALFNISQDLHAENPNDRQYIIAAVFLGLAIGQLFYGPLSDSTGRKPAIYIGFGLFLIGCLLSIFAENFTVMLIGRLLQGLGVASPRIVSLALIRDQYEGREMARFVSLVMTVFILVPVLAPALGQLILIFAEWRMIFVVLFILGLATLIWFSLRQEETLAVEKRARLSIKRIWQAANEVVRTRAAFGFTMVGGFIFSAFLGYLTMSQQIFQDQYGVGEMFAVYFGLLALALGAASFVNARLVMRFGMRKLSYYALVMLTLISVSFMVYTYAWNGHPPLWTLVAFFMVIFFCIGILFGNFNAMAMEPLGHIAGVAAAVIGSITTFVSMGLGTVIAQLYDGTVFPLVSSFAVLGALSLAAMIWTVRTSPNTSGHE